MLDANRPTPAVAGMISRRTVVQNGIHYPADMQHRGDR